MHYPNQISEYEAALQRVAGAIEMARRGAYRDGYLKMILEALETLSAMCVHVGLQRRDAHMIESLKREFHAELTQQPQHAAESPLAALVASPEQPEQPEQQDQQQYQRNPLNRR